MNATQLIHLAKSKQQLDSDYALAVALSVNRASVSMWKSGRQAIPDYYLLRLSEMANVPYAQSLAARALQKETNPEKVAFWKRLEMGSAMQVLCIVGLLFAFSAPLESLAMGRVASTNLTTSAKFKKTFELFAREDLGFNA
jgi:hypothetical protein